jgi:hypothetical protein
MTKTEHDAANAPATESTFHVKPSDHLMTSARLAEARAAVTTAESFCKETEQKQAAAETKLAEVVAARTNLPLDEGLIAKHLGAEEAAKLKCEVANRMLAQARAAVEAAKAAATKAEWQHFRDRTALRVDAVVEKLKTEYQHHATAIARICAQVTLVEEERSSLAYFTTRMKLTEKIPAPPCAVVGIREFEKAFLPGLNGIYALWPVSKTDAAALCSDLPDL